MYSSDGLLRGACHRAALRADPLARNDGPAAMRHSLCQLLAALTLAMALEPCSRAEAQAAPVELRILAINDFHGYLRPPPGGIRIADPHDKTKKIADAAGGAEYMATLVRELRDGHNNNIFVAAGALIGASPFLSARFHNEPALEALS